MQENKLAELIIKLEEGFKSKPYHCSEGFVTIGYGRKLSNKKYDSLPNITVDERNEIAFVRKEINDIVSKLSNLKSRAWQMCSPTRKAILISMTYQLGISGVMKFEKMWKAIEMSNFEEAYRQMIDSLWYKQTRSRALRHAKTMKDSSLDLYYTTNGHMV